MKNLIYSLLIIVILALVGFIVRTLHKNTLIQEQYAEIPLLKLVNSSDKSVSINDIIGNKPTIIMLFSIDCEHCDYQLKEFENHKIDFPATNLIFISFDDKRKLFKFFEGKTFFDRKIFYASVNNVSRAFGLKPTPYLFIYDNHKRLIKRIDGEIKIPALTKIINNLKIN